MTQAETEFITRTVKEEVSMDFTICGIHEIVGGIFFFAYTVDVLKIRTQDACQSAIETK